MAFEHLSIKTPKVGSNKPPTGGGFTNWKPPVTGGPLPPFTEGDTTPPPEKAKRSISKDDFQRAFQAWFDNKWKNGGHSVFAGFGDGAMMMGRGNSGGGDKKPPTTKPPATPTPQWAFQPNPLDQPSYQTPMLNAAAYTINPPAQQWMFDPATYGAGAPPQWYGQPVMPNSQPPFRY